MTSLDLNTGSRSRPTGEKGVLRVVRLVGVLVVAYFGVRFLVRDVLPFAAGQSSSNERFWERWLWIIAHVSAGTLALGLGALQLATRLRSRFVRVHRWGGRLYIAATSITASAALYLAWYTPSGLSFGVPMFVLAVAWIASTAVGYSAIRQGRRALHRRWMLRSYVLALAFVVIRLLGDLPVWAPFGDWAAGVLGWACWLLPLAALEGYFRIRDRSLAWATGQHVRAAEGRIVEAASPGHL